MKKIILTMLFIATLLATSFVWAEGESAPSKEIETIMKELKDSDWTLDVSGFTAVRNERITEDPLKGAYEQYTFPPESVKGNDMYHYTIKFDKNSGKFWIWRVGGFAYTNILYGPGYLDDSGKIIKKIESNPK